MALVWIKGSKLAALMDGVDEAEMGDDVQVLLDSIGDIADLTNEAASIVAAINALTTTLADLGDLGDLDTEAATIVAAINALDTRVAALEGA